MVAQPAAALSILRQRLTAHAHVGTDTCPWCEQVIPPEKFQEISGKIAAREREQTEAITTRLEQQFAADKVQAEAKAKADLELERQQSAAREAAAREEERQAAAAIAAEKLAEAERGRQELQKNLQQQVAAAETARIAAEQAGVAEREQYQQQLRSHEAALAAAKAEAAARETEIRTEAQRMAQEATAEQLAAAEAARQQIEEALQTNAAELEATKTAATQRALASQAQLDELRQSKDTQLALMKADAAAAVLRAHQEATEAAKAALLDQLTEAETARHQATEALQTKTAELEAAMTVAREQALASQAQLDELRQAKDAELAQAKENTAAETARARQEATQAAEAALHEQITEKDLAIAAAQAHNAAAEQRLATLASQQQETLKQALDEQREILEKDKDEALNAEKARAFDETQKLSNKLAEAQRALEKKTADELGEGAEVDLFEALKEEFQDDRIERIAKGRPGADVHHLVIYNGRECGIIVYDSKNHGRHRSDHVTKLRADQLAAKADHAILSTRAFPAKTAQLHVEGGVLLANPARVVTLVKLLRQHMIQIHSMRMSNVEREEKIAALYDFIRSDRCSQFLSRIDANAQRLLDLQVKEKRFHDKAWEKEGELIRQIQKAQGDLSTEICRIIGTAADPLPELEETEL